MFKNILRPLLCVIAVLTATNLWASPFDLSVLAAACQPDPRSAPYTLVNDSTGIGVTFQTGKTGKIVLYCQLHGDATAFLGMTIIAQDNSAGASATAVLYRQFTLYTSAPRKPENIGEVTTIDTPGVQNTLNVNNCCGSVNDELSYTYWITITLKRTDAAANLVVYGAGVHDVL